MSAPEPNISVQVERREPAPAAGTAAGQRPHPNTCPSCSSHYRDEELTASLRVCTVCGHHFPVGALMRIDQIADAGSFDEIARDVRSADPLGFVDLKPYVDRLAAAEAVTGLDDAVVVGSATLAGRPVVLAAMDFSFLGGSMGSVVGEKLARACDLAVELDSPLITVTASGGARMQENVLALMQMAKTVTSIDGLHDAGVPYLSVLAHPTTGGVMASFAALGDVILAEPGALMSFAGPRVVQQTTREELPADFGRAESNYRDGHVDLLVPRGELREMLARLLGLLLGPVGSVEIETSEAATPLSRGPIRRLLRRLRRRGHGPASSNGAPA